MEQVTESIRDEVELISDGMPESYVFDPFMGGTINNELYSFYASVDNILFNQIIFNVTENLTK